MSHEIRPSSDAAVRVREMSELSEGQRQAVRDAYTTLRSIRQTAIGSFYKPIREMCETSEYLLVAEFPEVKELETVINKGVTP